jgi:hypothetical protein
MSYAPYLRTTSGIVFFGELGNQPTFYSDSNFLIQDGAAGYIQAPNLIIGNGGNLGSIGDTDAISIASNGNVTLTQSLSVAGNLTVNGTTTTVNSTVVTVSDPIIILGSGAPSTDDNLDRGIAFNWHNGTVGRSGFFGFDDSIQGFTFITVASGLAGNVVTHGDPGWAVFAGVSGALAGNATTATTLQNSRFIGASGHVVGSGLFNGSADQVPNVSITSVAILGQTAEATPDDDDQILIYDNTAAALRRQTRGQFLSGIGAGSMNSFTLAGDAGASQTINDGNTVTIVGGSGIQTVASNTDTLTVNIIVDNSTVEINADTLRVRAAGITANEIATSVAGSGIVGGGGVAFSLDISEYSVGVMNSGDSFFVLSADNSTEERITISQLGSWLAGTNITVSGDGRLTAVQGSFTITDGTTPQTISAGDTITFSDSSRINFTTSATDTVSADLVTNSVSETYLTTSVAGSGIVGGNGSPLHVNVDNSTVEINSDTLRVKDDGITEAKLLRVVVTDTTTSSMADTEDVSLVNAAGGAVTLTLPSVTNSGRIVTVKKTDSSSNLVTVQRAGGATIDGATTKILYSQYESISLISDGTNWHII